MNEILMTNIFFMITAIASVIITVVIIILLVNVIKLVRKISRLTDIVTEEAELLGEDIDDIRTKVRSSVDVAKNFAAAKILRVITKKIFGGK